MSVEDPRVLSIQSHVVHGYVGNRSAVFPMQLLGLEVDVLNTVHFSNHTGYKKFRGQRMNGEQLLDIIAGLEENDLLQYTHLLTGYVGNPPLLRAITETLKKLRKQNPESLYVCDPVMGDENKLYVPPELVDIYRDEVIPLADIITPNQFECELLSGQTLTCDADVVAACNKLHALGPRVVVISSFVPHEESEFLWLYASEKVDATHSNQYKMEIPRLNSYYSGTGDLFAALLLAWLSKYPKNLKHVLENIIATIQAVMKRTSESKSANNELRLIQSREDIQSPKASNGKCILLSAQYLHVPITHVVLDARQPENELLEIIIALKSTGVSTVLVGTSPIHADPSIPFQLVNSFDAFSWADLCTSIGVLPVNALFFSKNAPSQYDVHLTYQVADSLPSTLNYLANRKIV